MHAIIILGLASFVFCLVLTPLFRGIFVRLNVVDRADTDRKIHVGAIPRIGGIPIVLSYVLALGLVLFISPASATLAVQHKALLASLLPATGLVFVTGLLDDIFELMPLEKLAGQTLAAGIAVSMGARISLSGVHPVSLWIVVPLSMFWLLVCTNALNLIDGMDGLASGVGLLAAATTMLAGLFSGNTGLVAATVPLVACLLAFLRYNFNPASIFLGDCGSLTIGFMLGCFGLIWSQHTGTLLGMAAPLMTVALPLIDVFLSIGRRYLRSAPIMKADRRHIHHMILARGFNPTAATLILYGVCITAGFLALMQTFGGYKSHGLFIVIFCVLVFVGVNYLGYVELSAARRTFSRKMLLQTVKEEVYLDELTQAIGKATDASACWKVILTVCADMNFSSVRMRMQNKSFEHVFHPVQLNDTTCSISFSFGDGAELRATKAGSGQSPVFVMRAIAHLQQLLANKEALSINGAFSRETRPDETGVEEYSGAA